MYQSKIGLYYDYATFLKLRDLNKYFYNIEKQNEISERYQYLNDHTISSEFLLFYHLLSNKEVPILVPSLYKWTNYQNIKVDSHGYYDLPWIVYSNNNSNYDDRISIHYIQNSLADIDRNLYEKIKDGSIYKEESIKDDIPYYDYYYIYTVNIDCKVLIHFEIEIEYTDEDIKKISFDDSFNRINNMSN